LKGQRQVFWTKAKRKERKKFVGTDKIRIFAADKSINKEKVKL